MPKSVPTPRKFLELANRGDAKWVKVKKLPQDVTKFKLRTSKYLYTLVVKQQKFIELVTTSIPDKLEVIHLDKKSAE
jgi:large subunit ribosomal protein L38e